MTTDRVELVIAVLGLLLGDGLLVAVANQVRERRQRYYRVLEDLLVPLDRILRRNKRLVDDLQSNLHQRAAEQHEGVELHPEALRRTFEALPEGDPRRVFWRTDIEELQTNNAAAVRLIDERGASSLLGTEFTDAAEAFRRHAREWERRWKFALGQETTTMPAELRTTELAESFPSTMNSALERELDSFRKNAGIRKQTSA